METKKMKENAVRHWYWSQPENGWSIEECEQLAAEVLCGTQNKTWTTDWIAWLR